MTQLSDKLPMKLEDQVCSLELSKRLKKLGMKQDAFWSWYEVTDRHDTPRLNRSDEHCPVCTLPQQSFEEKYSAFTVAELMGASKAFWSLSPTNNVYSLIFPEESITRAFLDENPANSFAKMLIYLLENKFV